MSKVSEREWKNLIDPESEEYSPPILEINDEQHILKTLSYELEDIEYRLDRPTKNRYTVEEDKFAAADPDIFWNDISHLRADYLKKIKDPELRKKMKERILKIEQKIYKQFIPFVESKINMFGWQNSPLEKYTSLHKLNSEEIMSYFEQARSVLESLKISKEEQVDFANELDLLKEKLDRYQNEPTLFTFEKIEEELQKEISNSEYTNYHDTPKKSLEALFDLLFAKAHSLNEIAGKMLNKTIKNSCEARAKSLLEYIKYLKEKSEPSKTTDNDNFKVNKANVDWAWTLLGVERDTPKENVRQAYHKLALKYHPDINRNPDATERMKKINEAFEMIKRVGDYK